MEVEKVYLCVACGNNKKSGAPYSILKAIVTSNKGQWVDDRDFVKLDVIKPVGTKFKAKTSLE